MSVAKKISLLVLLLLLLMVSCVYFHVDEITQEQEARMGVISEPRQAKTISEYIDSTLKSISGKFKGTEEPTQKNVTLKEKQVELTLEVKEVKSNEEQPSQEKLKEESAPVKIEKIKQEKSPQQTNDNKKLQKKKEEKTKVIPTQALPKIQKESTPKVTNTAVEVASEEPLKTFDVIQNEINTLVKKKRIIFKRLSTDVTDDSLVTIEQLAQLLKQYKDIKIEVGGHTDAKGDDEVNAYVSKHRALSVRKLLINAGISEERLTAKGYGESQPLVENDAQGYSTKNRRVEFKIIKD